MLKYYTKNCAATDLVLFVYVSVHNVELVKRLDYNLYNQLLAGLEVTHRTAVLEVPCSILRYVKHFSVGLF